MQQRISWGHDAHKPARHRFVKGPSRASVDREGLDVAACR